MAFTFEKLLVYQKSVDLADQICSKTEEFPRGYGFLVDQLNRAALSIAANIAEGNGRFTKPDRRNFFGIARGSVPQDVQAPTNSDWSKTRGVARSGHLQPDFGSGVPVSVGDGVARGEP